MEYEKINLNPQVEKKKKNSSCGCKEKGRDYCDNKINLKSSCGATECFLVNNYFSELVHEWEKEAARYNLGIQELESIEYVTDDNLLTKVIFKYRKGHELVTNEFYCAPQGPAGKDGRDGRVGATGPKGEKGDKGDTPSLNKVILTWVDSHIEEGGRFVEDCLNNAYNLELNLKRPEIFEELSNILNLINQQLTQFYAKKSDLLSYVTNTKFNEVVSDLLTKISSAGAEYRLEYNEPWLYLTKNGKNISAIKITGSSSGGENSYYYTGNLVVYHIFNISESSVPYEFRISGSDYENKGWTKALPDRDDEYSEAIWMASCWVESGRYGDWSYTKITGINGIDGVDSDNLEFIYFQTANSSVARPHLDNPSAEKPEATEIGWEDHPEGVTEQIPYEFYTFSKKEDGVWTDFVEPMIWSHYGHNGHDGDGVEYIFKVIEPDGYAPLNPTPENIHIESYQKPECVPSGWRDDPVFDSQYFYQGCYQYVCLRKYKTVTSQMVTEYLEYGLTNEDIGSKMWLPFSEPSIWNYYAVDGDNQGLAGAVIRMRGEWQAGNTYYRNEISDETNIKYIDVVSRITDGQLNYYIKKNDGHHTSSTSWQSDMSQWVKATNFNFIATRALFAENANINYLDSNEVRIWDSNVKNAENLVAGMTSGLNLRDGDPVPSLLSENPIRIWAGNTNESGNVNLQKAPFKVYNNGKLVADSAKITGDVTLNSLILANSGDKLSFYEDEDTITLHKENDHRVIYVFTGADTTTIDPVDCDLVHEIDNTPAITKNSLELEANSQFLIINTNLGWRIIKLKGVNVGNTTVAYKYSQPKRYDNVDENNEGYDGFIVTYDGIKMNGISSGTFLPEIGDTVYDWADNFQIRFMKFGIPVSGVTTIQIQCYSKNSHELLETFTNWYYPSSYNFDDGTLTLEARRLSGSGYATTVADYVPEPLNGQNVDNLYVYKAPGYTSNLNNFYTLSNLFSEIANSTYLVVQRQYLNVVSIRAKALNNGTLINERTHEVLGEIASLNIYNISGNLFILNYQGSQYVVDETTTAQPVSDLVQYNVQQP